MRLGEKLSALRQALTLVTVMRGATLVIWAEQAIYWT